MKSLQLDSPHAIVVIGIQGSGKSFFASKFASTFNAPYLDESVFQMSAHDAKAATRLMGDVLTELLKTDRTIVLEQAVSSKASRLELTNTLKKAGYTPLYVWVQVDIETAVIRSRRLYKVTEAEYKDTLSQFSPPTPAEKPLVISGKHTFATQAKAILKRLTSPRTLKTVEPQTRPQPTRGQIIVR